MQLAKDIIYSLSTLVISSTIRPCYSLRGGGGILQHSSIMSYQKLCTITSKCFTLPYHKAIPKSSHVYRRSLSTKKSDIPSSTPVIKKPSALQRLKTPALFGVGLYLGFMLFGEHNTTKEESAYFTGLRNRFDTSWGGGKSSSVSSINDDNGQNNDGKD